MAALAAGVRVVEGVLIAVIAYNLVVAAWGWPTPAPASPGTRRRRFRIVIPAHDEEPVIEGVLGDLVAQDYDVAAARVCVVADRCTDATALVARGMAEVRERSAGQPGKGAALAWYLAAEPLDADESLVVLDADNRVPPGLLARFADELDAGAQALQAYLDVVNPDGSALSTASALSYWASNRMVQLARANLGWTADLGGTGMCITAGALDAAGGFAHALTEDQDLTARLLLAGVRVRWLHDVRVRDEKPNRVGVAVRQRARWAAGRRAVARAAVPALARRALADHDAAAADLAVRLLQPGRMFVALLAAVLAIVAAVEPSRWLLPWTVWAVAAGASFLWPLPFLRRDRVPARYLVRYPLVTLLAALWIPVRVVARVRGGAPWERTPHGATSP